MGQSTGLFKVVRHMPEEDHAKAPKYLIKSLTEGFERVVHEFDLEPSDGTRLNVTPVQLAGVAVRSERPLTQYEVPRVTPLKPDEVPTR